MDQPNAIPVVVFALRALANTLPYILIAVIMIAWLKAASAEAYATRVFEGRENRMIVFAALVGGLAPFCSCEVIPFIAGLLAFGAPLSAIMAFWLSSPLVDPPTLIITASALGWPFAIGKAAAAVFIGLAGGFAIKAARATGFFSNPTRPRAGSTCCSAPKPAEQSPRWTFWHEAERRDVFRSEFIANGVFLVKWLAFAYVMEALLVTYVPASLIAASVGGDGVGSIITAAVVGMPAYLNGYVAPPLLAGLMDQGMGAGAAMAFMVAGAVSSIPAMAAVWSLVNRGVFATYLALGLSGAIVSGIIFQAIH
ncbi:permease [Hoeflea prorocentri]|uniref:Permease n=1 Tax=Hoeflea prorocentri TaxID=1922333 RepID=A0A9X3UKZ7_9HYPH|nr:permease [Hoeflea prorocentri]MCY6381109.1 permease [Hoeflea prorocentri]MDA5398909.1 permease [Hoeflea prorocentri]